MDSTRPTRSILVLWAFKSEVERTVVFFFFRPQRASNPRLNRASPACIISPPPELPSWGHLIFCVLRPTCRGFFSCSGFLRGKVEGGPMCPLRRRSSRGGWCGLFASLRLALPSRGGPRQLGMGSPFAKKFFFLVVVPFPAVWEVC